MNRSYVVRFLRWSLAKIGWLTILSLSLLLLFFSMMVINLNETVRGVDIGMLFPMTLMGLLFGWWLGRYNTSMRWVVLAAVILGFGIVFYRVGRLSDPALTIFRTLASIKIIDPTQHPDWDPLLEALMNFGLSLRTLITRTSNWVWRIVLGVQTYDPIAIAVVWSMVFWILSTWAAFSVRRWHRPLLAAFPAGAFIAGILNYSNREAFVIVPMLGTILLLMALTRYSDREGSWQIRGIDYSEDLRLEYFMASGALTIVLIGTAAIAPSLSIRNIARLAQELLQRKPSETNPIADSFGLINREEPISDDFYELYSAGLPRSHLLGSGPELRDQIVMLVETNDPSVSESIGEHEFLPLRYYWRSLTYDRYLGSGWGTGKTKPFRYSANQTTIHPEAVEFVYQNPTRRFVRLDVKGTEDLRGNLYHAGTLISADNDYQVAWRRAPIDQELVDPSINPDMFGALINTNVYQAVSVLPNVGVAQLRSAGENYPDWVTSRYLTLPNSVPERVISLALDLTATEPTPYDRAKAIESYLRGIPYNLDIPAPPLNRDVVDYFIFNLGEGYCDYYATAMVVLARAAGIPSRLVIGYANGRFDADHNLYVVTGADAHSWPEIYFPDLGWIEFEPTAGQPSLEYPRDTPQHEIEEFSLYIPISTENPEGNLLLQALKWIAAILILIPFLTMIWLLLDRWRLQHYEPAFSIRLLYRRLYRHGRQLIITRRRGFTPNEFAASLRETIALTAVDNRWRNALTPASGEVDQLTDIYSRSIYSSQTPTNKDRNRAIQTWTRLGWRLFLTRLLRIIKS